MEPASSPRDHVHAAPATACVRLTGGSSTHATWMLEDGPGGTMITIGSDPGCDWKIKAASVPAHALSVLLLQGTIYVRSGSEGGVLLDGRPLDTAWQAVAAGARLDIGLARLEISMGGEPVLGDWTCSWRVRNVERPSDDAAPSILVDGDAIEAKLEADAATERELADRDAADVSGVRPSLSPVIELNRPKPRHSEPEARTSWLDRFSRSSAPDAPSLFGRGEGRPVKLWTYGVGCALLMGAYALWIALLER
jgi:predicted component of type VI protein secretion system